MVLFDSGAGDSATTFLEVLGWALAFCSFFFISYLLYLYGAA
jgi:hypothetical protein